MKNESDKNKGTYCLIISMKDDSTIKIGAMGRTYFKKGFYVYVGSALNSLDKRIERHISKKKKKHWHADYLTLNKNAQIKEVVFTYSTKKIECDISNEISKKSNGNIELFGCSDCNCMSHLYYFDSYEKALKSSACSYENLGLCPHYWFEND